MSDGDSPPGFRRRSSSKSRKKKGLKPVQEEEFYYFKKAGDNGHSETDRSSSHSNSCNETDRFYSFKKQQQGDRGGGGYEFRARERDERDGGRGGGSGHGGDDASSAAASPLSANPQLCLAIYIAMAHAGLALCLALLYGLGKLLEEYWRPIQWAVLCSMPLRELQTAIVSFWSHPLRLGLFETLLAVPLAVVRATMGSVIDSQAALLCLIRRRCAKSLAGNRRITFSKLMQWLVSFGLFVLSYERIGAVALPIFAIPTLAAISFVRCGVCPRVCAQGRMDPVQATSFVFLNCVLNGTEEYMALYL